MQHPFFAYQLHECLLHYGGSRRSHKLFVLQTAEAFSGVLRSNSTLREVDLSSNALGVAGGRMLREAIAENMYAYTLDMLLAAILNTSDASLI